MLFALALLSLPLGQTITVDDDGPADFLEIQAAIDFASPGDVILVSPGGYSGFLLDKNVNIVGTSLGGYSSSPTDNPIVGGTFVAPVLDGVTGVTIKGIKFTQSLTIRNGSSGVRVDACSGFQVDVQDSNDVLLSRCDFEEKFWPHTAGLYVHNSSVQLVETSLRGTHGDCSTDTDGGPAITSTGHSVVSVIQSNLFGGDYYDDCPFGHGFATDGNQAKVASGHLDITFRGTSAKEVGIIEIEPFATFTLTHSGVDGGIWTQVLGIAPVVPAEPFLLLGPSLADASPRRVSLFGPSGATSLLMVGPAVPEYTLPGIHGESIHLDPASIFAIFPFVLLGGDLSVNLMGPLPSGPSVVGTTFELQALTDSMGMLFATNSVPLVLGL